MADKLAFQCGCVFRSFAFVCCGLIAAASSPADAQHHGKQGERKPTYTAHLRSLMGSVDGWLPKQTRTRKRLLAIGNEIEELLGKSPTPLVLQGKIEESAEATIGTVPIRVSAKDYSTRKSSIKGLTVKQHGKMTHSAAVGDTYPDSVDVFKQDARTYRGASAWLEKGGKILRESLFDKRTVSAIAKGAAESSSALDKDSDTVAEWHLDELDAVLNQSPDEVQRLVGPVLRQMRAFATDESLHQTPGFEDAKLETKYLLPKSKQGSSNESVFPSFQAELTIGGNVKRIVTDNLRVINSTTKMPETHGTLKLTEEYGAPLTVSWTIDYSPDGTTTINRSSEKTIPLPAALQRRKDETLKTKWGEKVLHLFDAITRRAGKN